MAQVIHILSQQNVLFIFWTSALFIHETRAVSHHFKNFAALYTMQRYERKYPQNLISLGVFTLIQGVTIGFCCSATDGMYLISAFVISFIFY